MLDAFDVPPPPVPAQVPSGMRKHPATSWIPFANVDVAVPVWLIARTFKPPMNVDVAVDVAWKYGAAICLHASMPPANVEVPVPVIARLRVVVGASAD